MPPPRRKAALSLIADGADVLTGKLNAAQNGLIQAAKEKGVYVTGRALGSVEIAPDAVLTNIIEHWDAMYSATAVEVSKGKTFGEFIKYGYNTADKTTGADLVYAEGKPLNPAVPAEVVAELTKMKESFASGEMKLAPTPEDARSGK